MTDKSRALGVSLLFKNVSKGFIIYHRESFFSPMIKQIDSLHIYGLLIKGWDWIDSFEKAL